MRLTIKASVLLIAIGLSGAALGGKGKPPPQNTSPPTISGTPQAGQVLSANPGAWSGGQITYAYQWLRCTSSGDGCVNIAGATVQTYLLTSSDVGSTVRVDVTATNSSGSTTARSAPTAVVTAAPVAPSNTAPPTISGTAQVGQDLTADPGTWTGTQPINFAYQWRRCDSGGAGCSDIAGAVARTYTLVAADAGATIRATVTATNAGGSSTAASAATAAVAPAPASPPTNTSPPTISGTPQQGQTLTASPGTWTGTQPISYAYEWRRCAPSYSAVIAGDSPVAYWRVGETSGTTAVDASSNGNNGTYGGGYTLGQAGALAGDSDAAVRLVGSSNGQIVVPDAASLSYGDTVTYELWVRLASLPASTAVSNLITKSTNTLVLRILPSGAVLMRKSGGADIASSTTNLSVDGRYHHLVATKNGADVHIYIDGADVTGTVSNQTLSNNTSQLAIGHNPTATTTDSFDGYVDEVAVYNRALGAAQVQQHYAAASSQGCSPIPGATASTYTVAAADVGSTLQVAVTASNSAGQGTAVSAPTATVTAATGSAPANTSPPTVSGSAQSGQTLTASAGTWSGTQPISYAYQWQRCDVSGGSCAGIAGATGATYVVASGDIGSTLRVAVTASNGFGQSTAASGPTPTVVAAGSFGFVDQPFTGVGDGSPSGSKPESKLWWNDGSWWADMWSTPASSFHIFRLDLATQHWSDTGVRIDDRPGTRADALWDGTHLYVASHVFSTCGCSTSSFGHPSRLYRYSYNAAQKTYSLDTGFPVAINDTSTETLVIDKDSTGKLWATWTQDSQVYVNRTIGSDAAWGTPLVLPVTGATGLNTDDISSLVAFGGNKIGVMWSDQPVSAMYFAVHVDGDPDTTWGASRNAVPGPNYADDHINLKSLQADGSGRVFAAVKTSLNDVPSPNPNAPLILLLVRDPATGDWSNYVFGRVGDDHTRPIVMLDQQNNVIHMFATAGTFGGTIYEKTSPLNAISFATGLGTPLVRDGASANMNNATSTKQNVNSTTGLVVLATNATTGYYWHNYEALGP